MSKSFYYVVNEDESTFGTLYNTLEDARDEMDALRAEDSNVRYRLGSIARPHFNGNLSAAEYTNGVKV